MSEKQKGARRRVSAVGRSAGSLERMLVIVIEEMKGVRVFLHGEAVVHETERCRPDDCANIFGNRGRLVQGSEFVDRADGFFLAPWSAACKHLQYDAA